MGGSSEVSGPDFGQGVLRARIPAEGVLSGHVGGEPVMLAWLDGSLHALSARCTHYGAPLAEGLRVGEEIRCPWHHACFSLRTGRALKAPAFAPLACWRVEQVGEQVFVRGRLPASADPATPAARASAPARSEPKRIVLVGGGAASFAAAERLREDGYDGALSMLSADAEPPCDRPNLSKDYLAGSAQESWIPLQPPEYYSDRGIDLRLGCEVAGLDLGARRLHLQGGETLGYDRVLLATGAEPRRLDLPGFDRPEIFVLRSLADAQALVAALVAARSVAVVGAGFIGLEASAALRARGLDVHLIAPDALPLSAILGEALAAHLVALQAGGGVQLHLGCRPRSFDGARLLLSDGASLAVDVVVVGVGVAPRTALAEAAGLRVERGILVDAQLRTGAPGVFAAGDVARYPLGAADARVEHWVHAQRQGQLVARNMLGAEQTFDDLPFFWTRQFGCELRYLGHGRGWNSAELDGAPDSGNCLVRYRRDGTLVAAAAIGRDRDLLALEAEIQR